MTDQGTAELAASDRGLSPQQLRYFETFGFVRLPGLFADDIAEITEAFEAVFAAQHEQAYETFDDMHFRRRRLSLPYFLEFHPRLKQLETDPRILGVVTSLIGEHYEYRQTDGNLLYCDTSWHCDIYDSPLDQFHIKLFFYLDHLEGEQRGTARDPGYELPGQRRIAERSARRPASLDRDRGVASV